MTYRPEIDGLRALAVVPVLLFHAGIGLFPGGYVGVDVFFVISGYLITQILLSELETGTFSVMKFYERRARRILPALIFVITACLPFAFFYLNSVDLKDFSQSIIAVATFSSNAFFLLEQDYFDASAEIKPLIHTWSLAVEEQFYLIFPLILFFVWNRSVRLTVIVVSTLFVASFLFAVYSYGPYPDAAFYLLPMRAWEILAGALCALYLRSRPSVLANTVSSTFGVIGLALIVIAILTFDHSTEVPSYPALVPVLGAVLIIVFAVEGTPAHLVLSSRLPVGMGLISYSTYLWHQPVLAFARQSSVKALSAVDVSLLLFLTVLLAYLTWRFIENPIRRNRDINPKSVLLVSMSTLAVFGLFGAVGHVNNGQISPHAELAPNVQYASLGHRIAPAADVCEYRSIPNTSWLEGCDFGDTESGKTVYMYGDSHGQSLYFPLHDRLLADGIRGKNLRVKGCQVVPYARSPRGEDTSDCMNRVQELYDYLAKNRAEVIVTSRWTARLYPIEGVKLEQPYRNSEGFVELDIKREYDFLIRGQLRRDIEAKSMYFEQFLNDIADASEKVYLVYPIPETGINIEKFNRFHFRKTGEVLDEITTPHYDYLQRNMFVMDIFDRLESDSIVRIEAGKIFCGETVSARCVAQSEGVPLYYDNNHLSYEGAELVVTAIYEKMNFGAEITSAVQALR